MSSQNKMEDPKISASREMVEHSFQAAVKKNYRDYLNGNDKATQNYIFENQEADALSIVTDMYDNERRVTSIIKRTKVGMDGLMIKICHLLCTHNDSNFMIMPENIRIITGMSMIKWQEDLKEKVPDCFKAAIFHHDQVKKSNLSDIENGLIIIDEGDVGVTQQQELDKMLKEAGLLNIAELDRRNVRLVFTSATMIQQIRELKEWGNRHKYHRMTIPPEYIGHSDFLEKGIIKEWYPLSSTENAEKWVIEDILDNYKDDYRVHIVRVRSKTIPYIQAACLKYDILFKNHTSTDRLTDEDIKTFFKDELKYHIVVMVKNFWRRSNLIPNNWKLRIGATHQLWTSVPDDNSQVQDLTGRMTGYWRSIIDSGHKTGPYRTSIESIRRYEESYRNPFGDELNVQTQNFRMKDGVILRQNPSIVNLNNIAGLGEGTGNTAVARPRSNTEQQKKNTLVPIIIRTTDEEWASIHKTGSAWNIDSILNVIKNYQQHLAEKLKSCNRDQISKGTDPNRPAYKKTIGRAKDCAASRTKMFVRKDTALTDDAYSIYLDEPNKTLCICVYFGKTPEEQRPVIL